MAGTMQLPIQAGNCVEGVRLSSNGEEVWLRTGRKDLFVWRCDSIGIEVSSSDLVFTKVASSPAREPHGTLDLSSDKGYALFTGANSVVLWNIDRS